MRSLDSSTSGPGRFFAMRVFLRAWARFLPFEGLELKNEQWQAVPVRAQYPASQRLRGPGRISEFQGLRKNTAARIIFSGDFRKCAGPWRGQSAARSRSRVPDDTRRQYTTSSTIICARSSLLMFGVARARARQENRVTT